MLFAMTCLRRRVRRPAAIASADSVAARVTGAVTAPSPSDGARSR